MSSIIKRELIWAIALLALSIIVNMAFKFYMNAGDPSADMLNDYSNVTTPRMTVLNYWLVFLFIRFGFLFLKYLTGKSWVLTGFFAMINLVVMIFLFPSFNFLTQPVLTQPVDQAYPEVENISKNYRSFLTFQNAYWPLIKFIILAVIEGLLIARTISVFKAKINSMSQRRVGGEG